MWGAPTLWKAPSPPSALSKISSSSCILCALDGLRGAGVTACLKPRELLGLDEPDGRLPTAPLTPGAGVFAIAARLEFDLFWDNIGLGLSN